MAGPVEGYVLHTYGSERYLRHAVASALTLRRYDTERPIALYCPKPHQTLLEQYGLGQLFQVVDDLPAEHRSVVGFKHHLHRFMPFDRCLFVDADMIWCRDPDPLWTRLSTYSFTATGLDRADFFFGAHKGPRVLGDVLLNRRRKTMKHFGLTYLPRVQAGMIYARDHELAQQVCEAASMFLSRQKETHFQSRLNEGRTEESCEWSLAMAMSRLELPIYPWFQGYDSPQLDYIEGLADHDPKFEHVSCRYYCNRFVYSIRGLHPGWLRDSLLSVVSVLPGLGDYMEVTPFVVHFGWLRHKKPFHDFARRVWTAISKKAEEDDEATLPASEAPSFPANGTLRSRSAS